MTLQELYRKLKIAKYYDTHLWVLHRSTGISHFFGGEAGLMLNMHGTKQVVNYTIDSVSETKANVTVKLIDEVC